MELYKGDQFIISAVNNQIVLNNQSINTTINAITQIISKIPRGELDNFKNLKEAITKADGVDRVIGRLKEKIEISFSKDYMKAYYQINMIEKDFLEQQQSIVESIHKALNHAGVTVGVISEVLNSDGIRLNQKILIAEGIPPLIGEDAKLKYYEISQKKPTIDDDNNADHYDMNFINNVKKGEWLGEKHPPTQGKNGKNVLGETLPGKYGKDYQLQYEKDSVELIEIDNVETLIAKHNGAVFKKGSKIAVDNLLIINGDVNYDTGSIDFDGYVEIRGTIQDSFSVKATKDISVKSPIGLGAVKSIESLEGDIFIRGGLNGKNVTKVIGHNIYIKYVKEATVIAHNKIEINLYAIDSNLEGKSIHLDSRKGRIIGGSVNATYRLETKAIGNRLERMTDVKIEGFNREELYIQLQTLTVRYDELSSKGNQLKRKLNIFENNKEKLDEKSLNTFRMLKITYEKILDDLERIDAKRREIESNLKTRGEGEVKIHEKAYPRTAIQIKNMKQLLSKTLTQSIYLKDNKFYHY